MCSLDWDLPKLTAPLCTIVRKENTLEAPSSSTNRHL